MGMFGLVTATKETSFVVEVIEVVGIVVEKDFSFAVFDEGIDDTFFGGSQGVESGEDNVSLPDFPN